MNIIIGVVVAVLIAIGGVFFFSGEENERVVNNQTGSELTLKTEERTQGTGSLRALFTKGDSMVCNYEMSAEDGAMHEGTMYFDADRERFHVRSTMTDEAVTYHSGVINDGVTLYTWSELPEGTFAFAMPIEETSIDEDFSSGIETEVGEVDYESEGAAEALDEDVSYDCVAWDIDESVFVPPANVEFVSPEHMLEAALSEAGFDLDSFTPPMQ